MRVGGECKCERRPMVWEAHEVCAENWVETHVIYLHPYGTQHDWLTPFGSQVMMITVHQDPIL